MIPISTAPNVLARIIPLRRVHTAIEMQVGIYPDVDPDLLYHPESSETSTHLFVGSSSSGKTSVMLRTWELLFAKSHITVAFLGNPHAKSNTMLRRYADAGHPITIVEGFSHEILKLVVYIAQKANDPRTGTFRYKFCVLLDDILNARTSMAVNQLMMSYRNVGISTMISIQHPTMVSPAQRSNANNLWVGGFRLPEQEHSAYLRFVSGGMPEPTFHHLTQHHGFLTRNTVEDRPWEALRLSSKVIRHLEDQSYYLSDSSDSSDEDKK